MKFEVNHGLWNEILQDAKKFEVAFRRKYIKGSEHIF